MAAKKKRSAPKKRKAPKARRKPASRSSRKPKRNAAAGKSWGKMALKREYEATKRKYHLLGESLRRVNAHG